MFLDTTRTLRMAQTKFQDSSDCLEKITPNSEGKTIMVPLTGSVSLMHLTRPKVAEIQSIEMVVQLTKNIIRC
jgi:prefoldin subunit 5